MRAREFTNFNFDIEPYEGWTGEGVIVRAYDGKDEIGHVIFEPTEDDTTQWYAIDVEVEEPYRRIGIATKMYDMAKQAAKSAGAIIVKSHAQSDDGRSLWGDKKVWEQQVNEYKEYPTREYEGVTFTMKEKDGQLIVKPLNDYGISMGHVVFNMDGKILDPQDLVIADKYQGQGIARVMYDYIKSQGFTIERSWDQTEAGKGFWDKHRGEDVRVWESEESNNIVYHGNQGGIHRELITPMWWTEDRDTAVYYATQFNGDGWIYSAKLTCKNPYVVKPTDETNTLVEKYKTLEKQGYDSIYDPRGNDWIPFHAQDIHLVGEPEYQEGDEELSEAFNQPYSIKWERGEHGDYDALAKLSDGTNLSIMFNDEGDEEWQVEFYRSNSQELTGEGDAQRVFATVLTAIQQFIQKEHPWRIIFSAKQEIEPGQYNTSRSKLYSRMVQRYANAWGYDEYEEDHEDLVIYELTRKKQ